MTLKQDVLARPENRATCENCVIKAKMRLKKLDFSQYLVLCRIYTQYID